MPECLCRNNKEFKTELLMMSVNTFMLPLRFQNVLLIQTNETTVTETVTVTVGFKQLDVNTRLCIRLHQDQRRHIFLCEPCSETAGLSVSS